MTEQQLSAAHFVEDFLSHSIVQQRGNLLALIQTKLLAGLYIKSRASLNSLNLAQTAITGNVGCLAGPGRQSPRARYHEKQYAVRLFTRHTGPIGQKPVKNGLLGIRKCALQIHKVHEFGINMLNLGHTGLNSGVPFMRAEWRKRGCAAKFKHDINLYRAKRGSPGAF